ncbi:MAG: efflux RND transporter periplasmic adaptor subunit [Anaerolineae bacterium]
MKTETKPNSILRWANGFALIAAVLLLTACGAASEEAPTPTALPRPVEAIKPTYEVQQGDITVVLQFTGRITPVREADLSFHTSGTVRNVFVAEGDSVTAGQVLADLAVIDDLELRQALDALSVRRAEVRLEIARLQLALVEAQPDSPTKATEVAIKENEVTLAEIALEEARLNAQDLGHAIANAQILAPFDGEIIALNVEAGDTVQAAHSVMVLADLDDLDVSADLRRDQLDELAVGMAAMVAPLDQPGNTVDGAVSYVPFRSQTGDMTVRVALERQATDAGFELRQRVQVTVVLQQKENVLWVPPQAVRTFEGRRFVVVQDGDVQQRVDVKLGLQNSDQIEITEGLTAGQIVVGP